MQINCTLSVTWFPEIKQAWISCMIICKSCYFEHKYYTEVFVCSPTAEVIFDSALICETKVLSSNEKCIYSCEILYLDNRWILCIPPVFMAVLVFQLLNHCTCVLVQTSDLYPPPNPSHQPFIWLCCHFHQIWIFDFFSFLFYWIK